ncbi:MAG TPA: S1 RNA-binding domain-containing protein, partial [Thermoanaerobaculia bacterium]|nr:S1 RNA-binding domain-containing protein [Thermoanaerobaculia bacterium]
MTRRMLINAQNPAELRVAVTSGDTLEDFKVDVGERGLTRGNIYFGIIVNIQPSLNAAFIDYGEDRDGFLSLNDLADQAWHRKPKNAKRPRIEEVLEKGKPILVQVIKDMEGRKGAALTSYVSLAGRYLVFTPFDDTHGVSRKVEDVDTRRKL